MSLLLPLSQLVTGEVVSPSSRIGKVLSLLGVDGNGFELFALFLLLLSMRIITQLAGQGLTIYCGKKVLAQLVSQAFAALVRDVPLRDIETKSAGSYIGMLGDESFRASNLVIAVSQIVSLLLLTILYFLTIFSYSLSVGLGIVAFLLVSFVAMFGSFRVSHRLGQRQVEQSRSHSSIFLDALNGLRTVRSMSAETYVTESYRTQIFEYSRTLFLVDFLSLVTRIGPVLLLLALVGAATIHPALRSVFEFNLPFVLTVTILLMRLFPAIGQLLNISLRVVGDLRVGRDVTHLVRNYPVRASGRSLRGQDLARIDSIEAVAVAYSHNEDNPVLKDFSVCLERRRSYALTGLSGSGKSTFLDLLMGFYALGEGRLLINGFSVEELQIQAIRGRVVLVSQETTIFNDTVANNIRFGLASTSEELAHVCRIACIHEFILDLEHGYGTLLSYRGSNLSGGQRQRIGIARALLRQPDVLLLDEATSALDGETRERIVSNLLDEFRDRIILFVTHDTYVGSRVDRVLNMTNLNRATDSNHNLAAT